MVGCVGVGDGCAVLEPVPTVVAVGGTTGVPPLLPPPPPHPDATAPVNIETASHIADREYTRPSLSHPVLEIRKWGTGSTKHTPIHFQLQEFFLMIYWESGFSLI